jgi:hypothetical protein
MQHQKQTSSVQQERRLHRMFVTRNTEYHFRGDRCVAVRDRRAGKWQLAHVTLNRTVSGSIRFRNDGEPFPTLKTPRVGDALFFGRGGPDVVTSVLVAIERPQKQLVDAYPY